MNPPVITHTALPVPHGFFGREGGLSGGVYQSLNCGIGTEDDPDIVKQNRARVRMTLGADHLISLYQIHSPDIVMIKRLSTEMILKKRGYFKQDRHQADGIVTNQPGLALSALSADCGPILLCDQEAGVVAACHAGWRGALSGIIESIIAAMYELGAKTQTIHAVLGPCIGPNHYEVGAEFRDSFIEVSDDYAAFFKPGPNDRPHFNLPAFILSRLQACRVENAHWTGQCTYADAKRYFSYRRNHHEGLSGYGRNISAIMLPD